MEKRKRGIFNPKKQYYSERIFIMLTTEQIKSLNIHKVHTVEKWDIKDTGSEKALYTFINKAKLVLQNKYVNFAYNSRLAVKDLVVKYDKRIKGYNILFKVVWEDPSVKNFDYFHQILRCSEDRYSNLSAADWFDIFTLRVNYKNPDPEKYTESYLDGLLKKLS